MNSVESIQSLGKYLSLSCAYLQPLERAGDVCCPQPVLAAGSVVRSLKILQHLLTTGELRWPGLKLRAGQDSAAHGVSPGYQRCQLPFPWSWQQHPLATDLVGSEPRGAGGPHRAEEALTGAAAAPRGGTASTAVGRMSRGH